MPHDDAAPLMEGASLALRPGGAAQTVHVDVCMCVYRRASAEAALRSVASQRLPKEARMRVVVADNDDAPSLRERLLAVASECGLDFHYVHAPAHNISIARNACLDNASGDWAAFIDDDEIASPGWLAALLAQSAYWDAVFGPVRAVYSEDAPRWLREGQFHAASVSYVGGRIRTGYSGNVLIRRSFIERLGLRFDPAHGVAGGEDTIFFGRLHDAGGKFGFAPDAVIDEPTPPARANLGWLLRRSFRAGRSHGLMWLNRHGGRWRAVACAAALAKIAACAAGVAAAFWSPPGWRKWLLRGALHAGALDMWANGACSASAAVVSPPRAQGVQGKGLSQK